MADEPTKKEEEIAEKTEEVKEEIAEKTETEKTEEEEKKKKEEKVVKEEVKEEKKEGKEEKKEKKEIKLTGSAKKILDEVKQLSILEMAELVKAMEEEFGVSAAPVAVAAAPGGGGGEGEEEVAKDSYTVELTAAGDKKIAVIKVVKDILGLGLKDAKDIVDAAPKPVKENVPTKEAEEMKAKLEAEGATVTLK